MPKLIFEEIKKSIFLPNYYQITSFIDVLSTQLKRFNQNFYLNAYIINKFCNGDWKIRSFIIESFIKITKHITEGAFHKIVKKKKINRMIFGEYNENNSIEEGIKDLSNTNHSMLSYNDIDPSLLFFHEGNSQLFSIITNKNKNDAEYIELYKLKNYQVLNINENRADLPDYKSFSHLQFLNELKDILNVKNPIRKIDARNGEISLEEIAGDYVFTEDNFIKMILILLKIRANIPVIMMGETGCGKTLLIRKLSEMLNDGKCKMKIKNIHAGINDRDIINFINDEVIKEAEILKEKEDKKKLEYENKKETYIPKKLWVFFDDFNTCKSMGLISELMCKNSCRGKILPNNIVFIAACNPYRYKEKKFADGLDINKAYKEIKNLNQKQIKQTVNNLVYNVNQLPFSLLNFVFDFGSLYPEFEKKYIKSIISQSMERIFKHNIDNKIDKEFKNIHNLARKMVSKSQKFIRNKNGISSVSLREIRRFSILYEFLYGYLKNKKEIYLIENYKIDNEDNEFYKKLNEIELHIYSIILGVFVCYYLRISDIEERNEFRELMNHN